MRRAPRRGRTPAHPSACLTRRRFLQHSGALTLGFYLGPHLASAADSGAPRAPAGLMPNAFVRIGTDSSVTVISKFLEMGQGSFTGLATLLAEELDADWSEVRVEGAPADINRYANQAIGIQGTGASTAMASSFQQMREAGATARAMLVAAAARLWNVPMESITVSAGLVFHEPTGRRTNFGALTVLAAGLPVPTAVQLKDPSRFKFIGNPWVRRKDSHAKTNGSAIFTQDLKLPGMLVAVAAHPRRFGATVRSFDPTAAKAIAGVVDVVQFAGGPHHAEGVAVLAKNTWIAQRGRDALAIEWDESQAAKLDSGELSARYRALVQSAGALAKSRGDVNVLQSSSAQMIAAVYEVPYLAHAAMEPMNCLVRLTDAGVSIWNAEQLQTVDQAAIGQLLGIRADQVQLTPLYAGGSFGRRGNPQADYLVEAVSIARSAAQRGHHVPIKLVWMREDDMRAGYYRPAFVHSIQAGLDEDGTLIAWQQRSVGQSVLAGSPFESQIHDGIDASSIEGAAEPYDIPNLRIELITPTDIAVPVQWWRSAGHSHTAFATECMIDELATAAQQDPYQFRRALLSARPRELGVLDLVATKSGWSSALSGAGPGQRRGRGIALHTSYGTCVAQVAEVTISAGGAVKVDRVYCAVDCGMAINPNVVTAQMQGGIGFGLAAALYGAITLKDGVVAQANFDTYRPLRMQEMPLVEVFIVPSHEAPSGVGDPGTPPIAPALVNAIFNATGQRIRSLPIADQLRSSDTHAPSDVKQQE